LSIHFGPIAKMNTITLIISLVTKHNWKLHQLDVRSSIINVELNEEFYLVQVEGFAKQGQKHIVCRLKKYLYGLKQAPRSWYVKIDTFFSQKGFMESKSDPNLYINIDEKGHIVLLSLYIDDIIKIGSTYKLIEEIKI
jgi:hypothetical protein